MKFTKYSIIAITLGLLVAPLTQAQEQGKGRGEGRRGGQMMTPEARVEQLDKAVTLTAEQKTKITEIYTKAQEEMRAAMQGGGGDREANREKMTALMRTTREQVRAQLTDEQKKKFDEMTPERGGRGEGRRGKKQP